MKLAHGGIFEKWSQLGIGQDAVIEVVDKLGDLVFTTESLEERWFCIGHSNPPLKLADVISSPDWPVSDQFG
jgi:hypothetical protein